MLKHLLHASLSMLLLFCGYFATAQVTTATLNGLVQDKKGAALAAATVTIDFLMPVSNKQ